MNAQGITVDTLNKRVVVTWADRNGDVVPAPTDAAPRFTSSDITVLRLQPEPAAPWAQRILPVAPGTANIVVEVLDGLGNPYRNADGDVVTVGAVAVNVGPGLPETATISVADEPAGAGTAAGGGAGGAPNAIAPSVDPNAPGARQALVVDAAVSQAAAGGDPNAATAAGTALAFANETSPAVSFGPATHGVAYTTPAITSVRGGTPPYVFTAEGLPDGLTMAADGSISGVPTAESDVGTVTVTVRDAAGATATTEADMAVQAAPAAGTGSAAAPTPPASQTGGDQRTGDTNPAGDEPSVAGGVTGTPDQTGGGTDTGASIVDETAAAQGLGQAAAGAGGGDAAGIGADASGSGAQTGTGTGQDDTVAIVRDDAGKPLYSYTGTGTPDPSVWVPTNLATAQGARLYTFANDTAGGDATGASAEWEPYRGATQPIAA